MELFKLDPVVGDIEICVGLYRDVKNSNELKEFVKNGKIKGAIIKAEMLVNSFQVVVASTKAFLLQKDQKMKTRNVFTEILFQLSPSNKITECFKLFGITDSTTDIVVITELENKLNHDFVDGNLTNLSNLEEICDKNCLQKLYKISDDELNVCTFVNAVISQMAAKEFK